MNRKRWIRGKALATVIALRGVQVGDYVRLQEGAHGNDVLVKGWVRARSELVVIDHVSASEPYPIGVRDKCGVTDVVALFHIRAWRPGERE